MNKEVRKTKKIQRYASTCNRAFKFRLAIHKSRYKFEFIVSTHTQTHGDDEQAKPKVSTLWPLWRLRRWDNKDRLKQEWIQLTLWREENTLTHTHRLWPARAKLLHKSALRIKPLIHGKAAWRACVPAFNKIVFSLRSSGPAFVYSSPPPRSLSRTHRLVHIDMHVQTCTHKHIVGW